MAFTTRLKAFMLACLSALALHAADNETPARQTENSSLPGYVRVVPIGTDSTTRYELDDTTFYRVAGSTIFRVNRTKLNNADPFVQELADVVVPKANERGWSLVGVELRGAASPEGPYWNNVRLSKGRAEALRKYLDTHLDFMTEVPLTTKTVAEDYSYLLWLLERDGDSAAPLLRRSMDRHGDNAEAIKAELRSLHGGRVWARLMRDYFPKLRSARVVLWFRPTRLILNPLAELDERITGAEYRMIEVPLLDVEIYEEGTPELYILPKTVERPHLLSVSTNLLYDGLYMPNFGWAPSPNVGVEWFALPRWTVKASFTAPWYQRKSKHKFFQIRDYHLEVRHYFMPGQLHTGPYVAAYANAAKYGIGFSADKGWEGEGWGAALKAGYVMKLGCGRWRLDFHAAAGYFETRYDPYVWGNPLNGMADGKYYYDYTGKVSEFHRRNHRRRWFGPTEIGITLSYDLLYKRIHGRGVSFNRKEVVIP